MNRDWGLLITLALALLAIAQGLPSALPGVAAAPPAASKSSPAARVPSAKAEDDAARERDARSAANPPPPKCGEGEQLIQGYQQLYGSAASGSEPPRFRFLIALVPDPEESGHTDYFDAVLEGIEEAAAEGAVDFWRKSAESASSVRYVRDHYWLPWSGSDRKKRQSRCWEQKPGVILYRPAKRCGDESPDCVADVARDPALVVLLVGETPTWGVRAEVLQAALQTADAPWPATSASGGSPGGALHKHWYRILGPTFSGSAPSLRALLERYVRQRRTSGIPGVDGWEAPDPAFEAEFHIASGTATGDDVPATLVASAPSGRSPKAGLQVLYDSAVPSYNTLLQAMQMFLEQAGGKSALLSESGTAYGEQPTGQERGLLLRKFPPNLISLRKAYTSVDADEAQPLTRAPAAGAVHTEAQGELSDQTPITHDLALAEVLRELSQGGVRNIGISATDARDVIFIAERVGVQLPDVRLFTIGFDLRYLHPEHAKVLNGLLVAHAVPPLPAQATSMVRQNPMTQRVSAAGQYLLTKKPLEPLLARVSLIGNGSIRQITPDRDAKKSEYPAPVVVPRSYWIIYVLTLLVLAAGMLLLSGPALLRLLARLPRFQTLPELTTSAAFLRRRGALVSWFRRIDHTELAADDVAASLALVTVLVSAPLMLTPGLALQGTLASWLAWLVPVSVLLASYVYRLYRLYRLPRGKGAVIGAWASLSLVLAVAVASVSIGWSPPREVKVWILSGGSPMVAGLVALAMLLVVTWCWRGRLRSLDLLRLGAVSGSGLDLPSPPIAQALGHTQGAALPSAVLALEQRLLRVLRSPWEAPLLPSLINLAVLASVAAVGLLKPILSFEPGWHHGVLVAVGVLAILPITTCFAHLVVVARALRELLQSIASPELLAALARIPKQLAFRLESELVHARRGASELVYPVACLDKLAAESLEWTATAKRCRAALEDQLRFEAGVPFPPTSNPQGLVDDLLTVAGSLSRERGQKARDLADEYQACLVAIFSARYLQQLRSMVAPVVLGCVLAILMTSLYFVQPRHLIATATFLWVTAIILSVVAIYLALARDAVLSAIGGTVAGSVDFSWGLVARIAAVTVVPLASFVTSQYPEFVFWVTSLFGDVSQFVQ